MPIGLAFLLVLSVLLGAVSGRYVFTARNRSAVLGSVMGGALGLFPPALLVVLLLAIVLPPGKGGTKDVEASAKPNRSQASKDKQTEASLRALMEDKLIDEAEFAELRTTLSSNPA